MNPHQCKTVGCKNYTRPSQDFCMLCQDRQNRLKNTLAQSSPEEDDLMQPTLPIAVATEAEYTGGSVSYYSVCVQDPASGSVPYIAECSDLIEALGMDFNEGNAFKAIWRKCAARTLGKAKLGYKDGLYDAEKVVYFGERMVVVEERKQRT